MATKPNRVPFATFALMETDDAGILLCQNRVAQRTLHFRKGTNICSHYRQSADALHAAIAENGYAVALLEGSREAVAVVFFNQRNRLWWMFLEELQQATMRDAFLSRCDALTCLSEKLANVSPLLPKEEEVEDLPFDRLIKAGLNAQNGGQELTDAKTFLDGFFFPALRSGGLLASVTWNTEPSLPMPVSLANLAMSLLHTTQMFASFCHQVKFTLDAKEDCICATVQGARMRARHTVSAQSRRMAFDFAVMECCLARPDCRVTWILDDTLTCHLQWTCDTGAIAYLGNRSHRLQTSLLQMKAVFERVFSSLA